MNAPHPLPVPPRSVEQIERELFQARNATLPPVPNIGALQAAVSHWTTEATLDPEHKPALQAAAQALREGNAAIAERGRHNLLIDNLTKELEQAQAARRMELIHQADATLQRAIDDYMHSSLQAARSLRRLIDAQRASSRVPGARHNLAHMRLGEFNIPQLQPISNQGTLGIAMMQGRAQWESMDDTTTQREAA